VPITAGAVTVQVNGTPLQPGVSVAKLVATDAGLPVYAAPLTLVSVMTIDCVAAETYAGVRALAVALVDDGTVMVNRADAAATEDPSERSDGVV